MPAMFWKLPGLGKISRIGLVPPRPDPGRSGRGGKRPILLILPRPGSFQNIAGI